jgi:ATP synthase protein I
MSESEHPPRLDDLESRLRSARERLDRGSGKPRAALRQGESGGMAAGFRIAVEMIAALAVGVGIGLLLDRWLGTSPWMLILFFILGTGAAFLNLMRVARELDRRQRAAREEKARAGR